MSQRIKSTFLGILLGSLLSFAGLISPVITLTSVFSPNPVYAQDSSAPGFNNSVTPPSSQAVRSFTLNNPLKFNSISGFISALLSAVIAIGIPIAVLFVVYAGFKFVMAQGNPEELKSARSNLVWTLVGIGIFLGASLLAEIIRQTLVSIGVKI